MKTKQKKYNKYTTKKQKKYQKNKVKNTNKKLKNKTRKLRKNANKGGMLRFLTGNKVDASLPMTSTKTTKQRNLESLFLSGLEDNQNYGYNMIFSNATINFNLELTFMNSVPINQRLLTFVNKFNKLVTESQYEQIQSGIIPSGLNIKKLEGVYNPIDYNDLPDIEELYDIVLKSGSYGAGQQIKNSENIGTTTIEKIIRIGVREINSIYIYYNNGIIFQPPNPNVMQISEQDYLNKIINLLRILKSTLRISNLQSFYLISFFPSIDEAILGFFIPFMNKINIASENSRLGYPIINSLCSQPYEGAFSSESNFLKRIRDYSDQINTFFGLNPPRTPSIMDYILGENMTQINSTGETLTLTKTSVCFLYLRLNPGEDNQIYRLLGLSLNTVNANITTGELTLGYKFIWTLNEIDITYIKKFATSNGIESAFSFLNDVYPLFSSSIKKMAYSLGVPRVNMGYGTRPPPSKPLITEQPRELVSPIVSGEEDESGFKTFEDGETPRPSEIVTPSDLIREESEKLKVPNIGENPRIQTA
jgi:hypothetical protein